ncbi:MAG: ABC transporter permease [Streptococcaceae bacterium]|jgi:ABC-2 type transport system permease protein|nr:ABC transporter permease [Streptococcaceae bacterium]
MRESTLILQTTLKRLFRDKISYLSMLLLPMAIIIVNIMMVENSQAAQQLGGVAAFAPVIAILIIVMFQYFGGEYMAIFLEQDFSQARKWRLASLPVSKNNFIFSSIIASVIFSLIQSLLMMIVATFVYDITWGNVFVQFGIMIITSILAQFIWMTIYLITLDKKKTSTFGMVFVFATTFMGGGLGWYGGMGFFQRVLQIPTPFYLSTRLMFNVADTSMPLFDHFNSGLSFTALFFLLVAMTIVMGGVVAVLGKRREVV